MVNDDLSEVRRHLGWHEGVAPNQRCAVIGHDGTVSSAAALAYARGWAVRSLGAMVIVHVDPVAGSAMAVCACAMTGVVAPEFLPPDMSADVQKAMASASAPWAFLNVRGDVADQLEWVARLLEADVIVVGKSARSRLRIAPSVGRRLLSRTRHIIVVV